MTTKPKAVGYCRVSSEEQLRRNADNMPTQVKKVKDFCHSAGLELMQTFEDAGESAYTQSASERPQLQKMLSYLREHRRTITHVVFCDLSRLARRIEDQVVLLTGFEKAGLKWVSVDEPSASDTSAAGKLATGMLGLVNQFHSAALSERVTFRMKAGTQAGRHLHMAPLGYLNGTVNGVKNLIHDPERAELVRKAFSLVAEGHTLTDVLRIVQGLGLRTRKGLVLNKQAFSKMLHCRVYCGWVKHGDVTARGTFEPLISEELFQECQDVLAGKSKRRKHYRQHEDWPLRRFVLCGACGKPLTSGWVKNCIGKPYGFYFCEQKGCRVAKARKETIERDWISLLGMMEPQQKLLERLPEIAAATWEHRKTKAEQEGQQLRTRLAEQHALNKRAITSRVQGQISDEDFTVMKQAIAEQVEVLELSLQALEQERATLTELMKTNEVRLQNLAMYWQSAPLEERIELQFSLFPKGLRWSADSSFLNTANISLFQMVQDMFGELVKDGGPG